MFVRHNITFLSLVSMYSDITKDIGCLKKLVNELMNVFFSDKKSEDLVILIAF